MSKEMIRVIMQATQMQASVVSDYVRELLQGETVGVTVQYEYSYNSSSKRLSAIVEYLSADGPTAVAGYITVGPRGKVVARG